MTTTITLNDRTLPRLGMGCWAIGGPFTLDGTNVGWGETDDAVSKAAIEAAWDAGLRVFDSAQAYGTGHSETLLGEVLGNRDEAFVTTKVGLEIDPPTRRLIGPKTDPAYIVSSLEGSRTRLQRDCIDLVLLHANQLPIDEANAVFDALDEEVSAGRLTAYGWSTDFPDRVTAGGPRKNFTAIQHAMNVFMDVPSVNEAAERAGVVRMIRSPLAMGLLTGKFTAGVRVDGADVRNNSPDWQMDFDNGVPSPAFVAQLDAVRDLLTTGGRSITQGALCWLLAKADTTLPVPGARTPEQATENARALELGPLPDDVMAEIEAVLDRPEEGPPRSR